MTILFVVPYVPSLIRTRSYNLIRGLLDRGHKVTVATVLSNERERSDVSDLRRLGADVHAAHVPVWRSMANCLAALGSPEPLQAAYSWSPQLASFVLNLRKQVDVVHVEHLRGIRYALLCQSTSDVAPVVWDSVDCISYLFEQSLAKRSDRLGRLVNRFELPRTQRFEGGLVGQFDQILITSELDRQALIGLAQKSGADSVSVLPNGVDTSYFVPSDSPRDAATVVFSGKMSYHANVSAVEHLIDDIMPSIWSRRPEVKLLIVGKDPSRRLRDMAARHDSSIAVTGTVPDVRPFLTRASLAAIPLVYGAGSQFKVLEAMACATPVVATPKAVAALDIRDGREAIIASDGRDFAQSVLDLLDDPARARAIGAAGRRYVEQHHSWNGIAARLESIYGETLACRGAATSRKVLVHA